MAAFKILPALAFAGVSFSFVATPAHSQSIPENPTVAENGGNLPPQRLQPLVVTPNLSLQTVGESLSSVTVIDEAEIHRQQPLEFNDLLLGQPGLDLVTNGAFGKNTSVFMRGTSSESTVLLIDGVRLRSASSGGAPWSLVPPQLLERVEIVRGPRSSLYGADAVGGVVQGFTHSAEGTPEGWVNLGAGSFDSQEIGAGVTGTEGRFSYSFSANHFGTDGTAIVENGEDKAFRNTSGIARVSHHFDNGGEAGILLVRAQGNTEYVGGEKDFTVQTVGLHADAPISDYWISRVQVAESIDEQDNEATFGGDEFDTRIRSARWQNHLFAGGHEFIIGSELSVDALDSTVEYDEDSRYNNALYGQAILDFGQADLHLSLRTDDNEAYGRHETGAAALGIALDEAHRLRFSYGTSFRAPTFNDLYYPASEFGGTTYASNPDLEPEFASSFEVGFGGRYDTWFWDAVAYQTDVDDLIARAEIAPNFEAPDNVDEARIRGLELSSGLAWNNWDLKATASLTDPRNRETDNRLIRRSGKQLRLDVDRELGAFSLGGTLVGQGYRYNDVENQDRLSGFTILDLRAGWHFAGNWSARVVVENVLDKEYTTARRSATTDYINAGRLAFASLRYDFR